MAVLLYVLLAFLLSAFFSWFIIPRILVVTYKKNLFDIPDERKVHSQAIPRLGGISFFPSIIISLTIVVALFYLQGHELEAPYVNRVVPEYCLLFCGLTLLYLTGVRDDLIGLRYRAKFMIQFMVACLFPISGLWINNLYGIFGIYELTPFLGIPFTILLTVFITNAINLIDGIDGLASGLSSVALFVLGVLFLKSNLAFFAILSFATLGILIPFFYYNVFGKVERRQKIFMGDTGSLTLGYILAFLAIRYASYDATFTFYSEGAIVVAFSTLIVPMFDVIRVVIVRARTGNHLFKPDQNHIHHKFLRMGLSPRRSMVCIILMACFFSITNIILVEYLDNNIVLLGDIVVWCGAHWGFDRRVEKERVLKRNTNYKC